MTSLSILSDFNIINGGNDQDRAYRWKIFNKNALDCVQIQPVNADKVWVISLGRNRNFADLCACQTKKWW
jgi:hypothetical protein